MRITVQLHPQHADYSDIRSAVTRAEALGVDTVYNWDHFYPLYGEPEGKHFEAWTMQAAWAEQSQSSQSMKPSASSSVLLSHISTAQAA